MDDDSYEPVVSNYYNFKSVNNLGNSTYGECSSNIKEFIICPYEINNDGKYPFLKYLLFKNPINDTLYFISNKIPIGKEYNVIVSHSKVNLFSFLDLEDYEKFNNECIFNGFYEENDKLYLFFDLTKCKLDINDVYRSNVLWFCLIDEIINQECVCDIKIDKSVNQFFINNLEFCVLLNEKGDVYETPTIGYVGKEESKLNFTYIFGEPPKNNDAFLGQFYYFTNFKNASNNILQNITNKKETIFLKRKRVGIVRFALFVGKVKHIENYPNDEIDSSEIKKNKLADDSLDKKIEELTMRITDYDGKWSYNYDSAHIGVIILDDGESLKINNQIVVKDYNQQIPLSYHYIYKNKYTNVEDDYHIE